MDPVAAWTIAALIAVPAVVIVAALVNLAWLRLIRVNLDDLDLAMDDELMDVPTQRDGSDR